MSECAYGDCTGVILAQSLPPRTSKTNASTHGTAASAAASDDSVASLKKNSVFGAFRTEYGSLNANIQNQKLAAKDCIRVSRFLA